MPARDKVRRKAKAEKEAGVHENEEQGKQNTINAYFVLLLWKLLVAPSPISSAETKLS